MVKTPFFHSILQATRWLCTAQVSWKKTGSRICAKQAISKQKRKIQIPNSEQNDIDFCHKYIARFKI